MFNMPCYTVVYFFDTSVFRHLRQLKTTVFLQRCLLHSVLFEWSSVCGPLWLQPCKQTFTDRCKHSSLVLYGNNYDRKKSYSTRSWWQKDDSKNLYDLLAYGTWLCKLFQWQKLNIQANFSPFYASRYKFLFVCHHFSRIYLISIF